MKTTKLAVALALVLGATTGACSSDPSTTPGGDDDGGGGGGGGDGGGGGGPPPPPPPAPLDATGKYAMHSTFDIATNMPGTAGEVVATIIEATDGDDDPTHWILDQLIAQIPNGTVRDVLSASEGLVAGYLNERLLDLAPDFLSTMVLIGHDFGDVAKHFGLNETLELTRSGTGYVAVHSVTGAHFKLGNQESDYLLANYHLPNVVVTNIAVAMDQTGQLTIAAHDVSLAYGQLLRLALDAAIIPAIDASAHSLNELLTSKVTCQALASAIVDAIHIGSTSMYKTACTAGLNAGANFVYNKIAGIDGSALKFGLSGSARAQDKNNDRKIDAIQTGTWAGTLSYGSTPTPLVPATFFGERL
ncbi:MAG TPA: hypothetical protein VGD80_44395 [Kofleriaceae bacterium]